MHRHSVSIQLSGSDVPREFFYSRLDEIADRFAYTMFDAVGVRLRSRCSARLGLTGPPQVNNLAHFCASRSIMRLNAGRDVIRAVYSLNTSVSGVILNSIMK